MKARIAPLQKWIPALTPRYTAPTHLAPFTDVFERIAAHESVEAMVIAPPRHEKTETAVHGIAWLLSQNPTLRIALITFSQRFTDKLSRRTRQLAEQAGVPLATDSKALANWRTGVEEGGLWATSVGGPVTGLGFDLVVLDDLTKDRAAAESPLEREKIADWFDSTLYPRKEPGASVIGLMHRWHTEDPAAHLIKKGFEEILLPAIDDQGRALLPERYTLADLARIRETIGEYAWLGLYQGVPPTRGGCVFQNTYFYDQLPAGLRYSIGCDFAYTKKTKADYSVAVVLGFDDATGLTYVVDVIRQQTLVSDFKVSLNALSARFPGVKPFVWTGGQEKGIVELLNNAGGCQIHYAPAVQDKFSRAQPVSGAWNAGKVLVPRSAPWLDAFVSEVVSFTGSDRHDDQVDALSASFERTRIGVGMERARIQRAFTLYQAGQFFEGTRGTSSEVFDRVTGKIYPDQQSYRWALQQRRVDAAPPEDRMAILQGKCIGREAILWNRKCGLNDDGSKKE